MISCHSDWAGLQVFQRQLAKEGLQQVVSNNAASADGDQGGGLSAAAMSSDELRDLFTLRTQTMSDTFDSMCADDNSEADVDVVRLDDGPGHQEAIFKEQACSYSLLCIYAPLSGIDLCA